MGNTISFFRQIKDSSSTAEHIEKSKSHWSERSGESGCSSAEEIEDNRKVFKDLLLHPTCGGLFTIFGKYLGPIAYRSAGLLSVGEKIAEGGQAEIYEAHVKWWNKVFRKRCEEEGAVFVLKVFKSGVSLRHLQSKWPEGLLKYRAVIAEREKLHIPEPLQYGCDVQCATVLRDGRFAFVMRREDEDLRSLIDRKRRFQWRHGPFRDEIAIGMMYKIARGMDWLHGCDIVHKDFKVSNVLVREFGDDWMCIIVDYECSIGVIGTGFWRAPEILQACKNGVVHQKPEIFSKATDVYSYGMTCYEILTPKNPAVFGSSKFQNCHF